MAASVKNERASRIFLFPNVDKYLYVKRKLAELIIEPAPAKNTAINAISTFPVAVKRVRDANGVINAHPGKTSREFRSTTQNKASSCK
jgi:hypothetical protein